MRTAITRTRCVIGACAVIVAVGVAGAPALAAPGCGSSAGGNGHYPPGQVGRAGVTNGEGRAGGRQQAHVPDCTFDENTAGEYGVPSTSQRVGAFQASSTGA